MEQFVDIFLEIKVMTPMRAKVTYTFNEILENIDEEKEFIDRVRCTLDEAFSNLDLSIMKK